MTMISSSNGSASNDLLTLAAVGMQAKVVVLLVVLNTTVVVGMKDVTAFLAWTVTVGPAGIVRKNVVVLVTPLGVDVRIVVVEMVLVCVILTSGAIAVNSCSKVDVLLTVLVFPLGVEVVVDTKVEIAVTTLLTGFGVTVEVARLDIVTVCN